MEMKTTATTPTTAATHKVHAVNVSHKITNNTTRQTLIRFTSVTVQFKAARQRIQNTRGESTED